METEQTSVIEHNGRQMVVVIDQKGYCGFRTLNESAFTIADFGVAERPKAKDLKEAERIVRLMLEGQAGNKN